MFLGNRAGQLVKEVQIANAPDDVTAWGEYGVTFSNTCTPGGGSYFYYFGPATPNAAGLLLAAALEPDRGRNIIVNWKVTLYSGGRERTLTDSTCYQPNPLTLDTVEVSPDFRPVLGGTRAELYLDRLPPGTIYAATYRFGDDARCGPGVSTLRGSGTLTTYDQDTRNHEWAALKVPGSDTLTGAAASTALYWTVMLTQAGRTVTLEDYACHDG